MKTREAYTELSVQLASIQAKLDWLIEQQKKTNKIVTLEDIHITSSPYALTKGDLGDSGLAQEWRPSGDLNV